MSICIHTHIHTAIYHILPGECNNNLLYGKLADFYKRLTSLPRTRRYNILSWNLGRQAYSPPFRLTDDGGFVNLLLIARQPVLAFTCA